MNFNVKICGFQEYFDENSENSTIELTTQAKYKYENTLFYIDYDESILNEDDSHTNIEVGKDYVCMNRTGSVNSELLFIKNKRTNSAYSTPYGIINIAIYTTTLDIDINGDGGMINIEYLIDINNDKISKNSFKIDIREV